MIKIFRSACDFAGTVGCGFSGALNGCGAAGAGALGRAGMDKADGLGGGAGGATAAGAGCGTTMACLQVGQLICAPP